MTFRTAVMASRRSADNSARYSATDVALLLGISHSERVRGMWPLRPTPAIHAEGAAEHPIRRVGGGREPFTFQRMTWIETRDPNDDNGALNEAHRKQRALYPKEYAVPTSAANSGVAGIVASH